MKEQKKEKRRTISLRLSRRGKALFVITPAVILLLGSAYVTYHSNSKTQEKSYIEQSSEHEDGQISTQNTQEDRGYWIYYGSHVSNLVDTDTKQYLNESVRKWTQGNLTDNELTEWMTQRLRENKISMQTAGVLSGQTCLFESEKEIPDYEERMRESDGIYEFIGLYTNGRTTEDGKLICFYWEAGVR